MVVSTYIYAVLLVLGSLLGITYIVFCFVGRTKICSKLIRLISSIAQIIISALIAPTAMSYGHFSPSIIVMCSIGAVISSIELYQLVNDGKTTKKR